MIDSYDFGQIVIDGQKFSSDLIIFPTHIKDSWWRKSGHSLCLEDLAGVFEEKPEVLVIGTGFYGIMTVQEDVRREGESKGVMIVVEKTQEAVERFNDLSSKRTTIGAFHLTC